LQVENPFVSDHHPIRDREAVELKVVGYCAGCGEEIHKGDDIIEIGNDMIHERSSCAYDYCSQIGFHNTAGE
jgi:hypothetical protein